jgi:site-specific DNA recombinase
VLDMAKRREFDILICQDPDRLARNLAKALVIEEELRRHGISIRYVTLRVGDSPEDRLLKNVKGAISEYEREKIAFRMTRGKRQKAKLGLYVGNGHCPYGYRLVRQLDPATNRYTVVGIEPDPATAPIVQRIFREAANVSLHTICERLTADGIPTHQGGKRWATSTLIGMIQNPAYRGQAAWGRREGKEKRPRDPSQWITIPVPALIDERTYAAAVAAIRHRKQHHVRRIEPERDRYLLRGMLNCEHCGGALACIPNNGFRYYVCLRHWTARAEELGHAVCELPAVPAEPLESHLWERLCQVLLDAENLQKGLVEAREAYEAANARRKNRLEILEQEIKKYRTRLGNLIVDRADAVRGSAAWEALNKAVAETEALVDRLSAEHEHLQAAQPAAGMSAEEALTLETFAAEVRQGMDLADPQTRRQIYEIIHLHGRVRHDREHGRKLGRRHRFSITWEAAIELDSALIPNGGKEPKKTRVRYFTPEIAAWEREHMPAAASA